MKQNKIYLVAGLLLIGLSIFSCSNAAEEKAKQEAEEEGFHLNISTKDGDVKIDASSKGSKKGDKDGFHLNISSKDGDIEINDIDEALNGVDEALNGVDEALDGVDEALNGVDKSFDRLDLKIEGSGTKLDKKVLHSLFPERIGWFKRSEYNFQNALGLVSSAEVEYTKGSQKVVIVVLGGAIGNIAGGFSDFFEGEFELEDSDIRQKTGEWNGLKYTEGYDEGEQKAFMHMVLDNRIMVMVAGENMSEWNFKWWWKRIDWKKLED